VKQRKDVGHAKKGGPEGARLRPSLTSGLGVSREKSGGPGRKLEGGWQVLEKKWESKGTREKENFDSNETDPVKPRPGDGLGRTGRGAGWGGMFCIGKGGERIRPVEGWIPEGGLALSRKPRGNGGGAADFCPGKECCREKKT